MQGICSTMAIPVLAVVYPACLCGVTATGLDGFRGSAARQMDELTSAHIISWASAEPRLPGSAIIACFPRKPAPRPERRRSLSGGGFEHGGLPVRLLTPDHGPKCASRLVCNGHCSNIDRASAYQCLKPGTRRYTPPDTGADHRPCAMDQQRSQITITALADPSDAFSISTR